MKSINHVEKLSVEDVSKKLEAYSKELNLSHTFSLDDLIESHRRVRENNIQLNKERIENWNESRERAYKHSLEYANSKMVHVEKLAQMSIMDIAKFINEFMDVDDKS